MHATIPTSDRLIAGAFAGDEGPFLDPLPAIAEKHRWPWHLLALLVLTVLAGASRFVALDRPAIWVDEASTFRRTCGTYEQMLHSLERDPFGPLFYEIEWLVRQFHHLTPFYMRLVPAIAGTLMIPAMYFLARQVAGIRTALVTALLTLCSAWLINYSRDAKMYMTLWLFTALSAGCFLWWMRTRTWTAWLSWIAVSCAVVGIDARAAIVIALAPIWMLTARRVHWAMGAGLIVGVLIIATGPVGYYQLFNRWRDKVEDNGRMPDISWVGARNSGAGGLDLVQDSSAAFLYSFTFIQEAASHPEPPRPVLVKSTIAFTAIVALLALGVFPWRRAETLPPPTAPEPWWRPTLWLGLWIVIPAYAFYCFSVKTPASPADLFAGSPSWEDCVAAHGAAFGWIPWIYGGLSAVTGSGHVWAWVLLTSAVAIAVIYVRRLGTALLGLIVVAAAIALLFAIKAYYFGDMSGVSDATKWHRPIDVLALWPSLMLSAQFDPAAHWRITSAVLSCLSVVGGMAIILPAVAFARAGRTYRQRLANLGIALLIVVGIGAALQVIYVQCTAAIANMRANGVEPTSMWVPRYLGFIWPAVAIAVAALLMRLPTRPLRWIAVTGVCALNLFVAYHRVFDYTEPRVDLMVADVYAGSKTGSTVRTYMQDVQRGSGPGGGSVTNPIGKYYFVNDRADLTLSPEAFMNWSANDNPRIEWITGPGQVLKTLQRNPMVNTIITWRAFFRDRNDANDLDLPPPPEEDVLLDRLGPGWQRTGNEVMPVRYHWSWAEMYQLRRRVYTKLPTTRPTTSPTPAPAIERE